MTNEVVAELREKFRKAKNSNAWYYHVESDQRGLINAYLGPSLLKVSDLAVAGMWLPEGVYPLFDEKTNSTYFYFDQDQVDLEKIVVYLGLHKQIIDVVDTAVEPIKHPSSKNEWKVDRGLAGELLLRRKN